MMKFRKKPVIIEAEQYLGVQIRGVCQCPAKSTAHCHTIHRGQSVVLEHGDWLVPEPDGEHFYPVKSHIFYDTYEVVH